MRIEFSCKSSNFLTLQYRPPDRFPGLSGLFPGETIVSSSIPERNPEWMTIEWKPGTGLPPSEITIEELEADFWGALARAQESEMKTNTKAPATTVGAMPAAMFTVSIASLRAPPTPSPSALPDR